MPRFLPVAMTALAVLASPSLGSVESPHEMYRELAIAADGYGQVGQTLFGVVDSAGTTTTSNVEFGSNVALSDDGLRLAVSARRHDWVSFDNSGTLNEDGGAVFIYDYDGSSWIYKTHFVGTPGEELGRWPISLSSDGQMIAIRRGSATRPAEVWNVDAAGVKTKLGDDITCTDAGSMLALTETLGGTTRLAVGCEFDGSGDSGLVKVLDWNSTHWNEVSGSPLSVDPSGTTDGLFGFDMAWALDGTRLAISAPNFEDTLLEQGLVQVYDFDGSTFTQLGANLLGSQINEKFGFTMGMSSDGETLVVGSPNKDVSTDDNTGAVRVYALNTTDSTWQFQQEILGSAPGDVFGRGISVKNDGTLFCASSSSHSSNRGQVRVFELSSGSWSSVAEFSGNNPGDLLGFNNMGVTMTDTGERLAMAAIHAQTNGIVQVFDDSFTPAPSLAPSLTPSASPAPSEQDPLVMGEGLGTFEWDIFPGDISIGFTEDDDTSEIQLEYNISLRDTKIQAFESDCSSPIPSNVTTLTSELVPTSSTYGNFTVNIDIQQDAITDSSGVWTDVGVGEGLISLCLRIDLTLGDLAETSVHFIEQNLTISVGLLQGFEINNVIDLDRLEATSESGSADFDYNVTACHCNAAGTCVNTVLSQGSDVYLCVETTAPNVEIVDIRELTMAQGAFNTTPIVAGVEDALTEVTIDGKEASIRYQIISAFFADANPADIVATGAALLGFVDDDGRRLLRSAKVVPAVQRGELERELEEEGWVVTPMEVASALSDDSSGAFACVRGFASVMVIVVGGVGAMVF